MLYHEKGLITDLRQSQSYTNFMTRLGWSTDMIGQVRVFSKKIPLLGTLVRIPRPNLPLPIEEIETLAKEKKALLVKIEPNFLMEGFNPKMVGPFKKDSQPVLPTKSLWIDLTKSQDTLFGNLDKDTRNLARRAEKEGVVILESNDLKSFYELWQHTAKKKGFFTPFEKEMDGLWKSFQERHILIAKKGGVTVAAALLFGYQEACYYYFAASNDLGRQVFAPYLLMWQVIVRSKKWGYQRLDLEGIADPKVPRTKKWLGFSHFKKGFGGQEVSYVGSFSKSYSPLGRLIGRFL